jgi:hypothetical protein
MSGLWRPEIKAGKKARCGKCDEKFRIPSEGEHAPSGTPVPTGEAELALMAEDVEEFEVQAQWGVPQT